MVSTNHNDEFLTNTLMHILDLSWRISRYSPAMKPFIRFSKQTEDIYKQGKVTARNLFWDFDYSLQRILLGIVNAIATPEQLNNSCIERWKVNLTQLHTTKQRKLEESIKSGNPYQFYYTKRDEFIFKRIKPKSRFLYLGCGSGTECLNYANQGYNVVGIDTDFELVSVANDWAEHLSLPFDAICMDAIMLGFSQRVFDSFLLEFYGYQTSLSQTLALQKNLADVLSDGGMGFIVASRKKYPSYWFLGASYYKIPMVNWLSKQCLLDFYFSQHDGCEEQLNYGLYWRTHTTDSLSAELSYCFDVVECIYEKHDHRYVICVVKRKENQDLTQSSEENFEVYGVEKIHLNLNNTSIQGLLNQTESICDLLESHEKSVSQFFDENDSIEGKNPITSVQIELSGFIELLMSVFKVLPVQES